MLGYQWVNGGQGLVLRVLLQDSSTGQGKLNLLPSTSGLKISAILDNESSGKNFTAAGSNIETCTPGEYSAPSTTSKCRFGEVDQTNHPGLYEIQLANERWSDSTAKYLTLSVSGVSGLRDFSTLIQLNSVPADLRLIGGNDPEYADLSLRSLSIYKDDGPAVSIVGGNVASLFVSGGGDGVPAILATGLNAPGINVMNISEQANSLPAMAVTINGSLGTGPALKLNASITGNGIEVVGGSTSGDALKLSTTDGDGLIINSAGSGKVDVNATLPDSAGIGSILSDVAEILDDTSTTGVVVAASSKNGYALSSAYDLYHADIQFTRDEAHEQDEYTVTWFKNGVRIVTGISAATIRVVNREDGTDLVDAETEMAEITATGSYKYNEDEVGNRIVNGEAALVIVSASIDGNTRSFARLVGRDAA